MNELKINGFSNLTEEEMVSVDGGGVVAAVYALGFVMGMTPAGALATVVIGAVALGAGIYIGVTN